MLQICEACAGAVDQAGCYYDPAAVERAIDARLSELREWARGIAWEVNGRRHDLLSLVGENGARLEIERQVRLIGAGRAEGWDEDFEDEDV